MVLRAELAKEKQKHFATNTPPVRRTVNSLMSLQLKHDAACHGTYPARRIGNSTSERRASEDEAQWPTLHGQRLRVCVARNASRSPCTRQTHVSDALNIADVSHYSHVDTDSVLHLNVSFQDEIEQTHFRETHPDQGPRNQSQESEQSGRSSSASGSGESAQDGPEIRASSQRACRRDKRHHPADLKRQD